MDGFEVRLNFLNVLRRLTSSQASINSAVRFHVKYGSRCGGDLWQCLMEECEKVGLNARINILYLLDSLLLAADGDSSKSTYSYAAAVRRDLARIVSIVVPQSRDGLLNLPSTRQILASWRTKRLLDTAFLDVILDNLARKEIELLNETSLMHTSDSLAHFSKRDVLERINDDRERHKRLRERLWVLPIPSFTSLQERGSSVPSAMANLHRVAICMPFSTEIEAEPGSDSNSQRVEVPLDAECEQLWMANVFDTGDRALESDDWGAMRMECCRYVDVAS